MGCWLILGEQVQAVCLKAGYSVGFCGQCFGFHVWEVWEIERNCAKMSNARRSLMLCFAQIVFLGIL